MAGRRMQHPIPPDQGWFHDDNPGALRHEADLRQVDKLLREIPRYWHCSRDQGAIC